MAVKHDPIGTVDRYDVFNNLLAESYPEVPAMEFYRDLFGDYLQHKGVYNDGTYCGIAVSISKSGKVKRYSLTHELDNLESILATDDFVIISPVSYCGKDRKQEHARQLFAVQVDADGVYTRDGIPYGLMNIFHQAKMGLIPQPTYVATSGNNIHLYYLLDEPLRLFPSVITSLNKFRTQFIGQKIYNGDITTLYDNEQIESATQGMRAIGTVCKDGIRRVKAYKTGERISVDELNQYVDSENRIKPAKPTMTIEEAMEKYPNWYARITGKYSRKHWYYNRAMYDNFVSRIRNEVEPGHRYWSLVCLCSYSQKCNISEEELFETAFSLVDELDAKTVDENNHFTVQDVTKALEAFYQPRIMMTRESVERLSGIKIQPQKRNGRKQSEHLKLARGIKALKISIGEDCQGGRSSKRKQILEYVREHRNENQTQVAKGLGISRQCVNSHWKSIQIQLGREEQGTFF